MHRIETMIRRLRVNTNLSEEDAAALRGLPIHVKDVPADRVIVAEGDQPGHCGLILKGFVCRSKMSAQGKRQILSFHIPGDIPDLQSLALKSMDHDLVSISPVTLGIIEHSALNSLLAARPTVARAFWRETLIDAAVFREWIVNLGVRAGPARMAHLFAELRERIAAIGLLNGDEFEFPLTQSRLGEALGLSTVHVNRLLQALREEGLLDMKQNIVRIPDPDKVFALAGFDDNYLHTAKNVP